MLPRVCSVTEYRKCENVVKASVTHSPNASHNATFLFLAHFDVICDQFLNSRTATWNLFVNFLEHSETRVIGRNFSTVYAKNAKSP